MKEFRHTMLQELEDALQAFKEIHMTKEEQQSPIDECNEAISAFCEHIQMRDEWELRDTEKDIQQLLERNGIVHLSNLCKYLSSGQQCEIPTTQALAQDIAAKWNAHPEFMPVLFTAEELKDLIRWVRTGEMELLPDEAQLITMSLWGLVEVEVRKERGRQVMSIAFPRDVDGLVRWLEKQDLDALERDCGRLWERLYGFILCYGYVDMQVLHEKYIQRFGEISWEDFKRCLYLKGRFREGIATGTAMDTQRPWVALTEEMAENGAWGQMEYGQALGYADFTKKQIVRFVRDGYGAVYPQWNDLLASLNRLGIVGQESQELLSMLYESIMWGDGVSELLEMVEEWLPDEKVMEAKADVWELLQNQLCTCWSVMGIPVLKGYSRLEVAEKNRKSVFEIAANDGYRLPGFVVPVQKYGSVIEMRGNMAYRQVELAEPKAAAADPDASCPCGSGKRYRQCCGRKRG